MDYKKRKHLLRCSALVEHRVKTNSGLLEWESDGYVDFETKIDIMFIIHIMGLDIVIIGVET